MKARNLLDVIAGALLFAGCGFSLTNPSLRVQCQLTGAVSVGTNSIALTEDLSVYAYRNLPFYIPTENIDSLKVTSASMAPVSFSIANANVSISISSLQARLFGLHSDLRDIEGDEIQIGELLPITVIVQDPSGTREFVGQLSITSFQNQGDVEEVHESCGRSLTQAVKRAFLEGDLVLEDTFQDQPLSIATHLKLGLIKFYPVFDCS